MDQIRACCSFCVSKSLWDGCGLGGELDMVCGGCGGPWWGAWCVCGACMGHLKVWIQPSVGWPILNLQWGLKLLMDLGFLWCRLFSHRQINQTEMASISGFSVSDFADLLTIWKISVHAYHHTKTRLPLPWGMNRAEIRTGLFFWEETEGCSLTKRECDVH